MTRYSIALLFLAGACADPADAPHQTAWPALEQHGSAVTLTVDYDCDGAGGDARVTIRTAERQTSVDVAYTCGDWSQLSVFDVCGDVTAWVQIPGEAPAYADPLHAICQ